VSRPNPADRHRLIESLVAAHSVNGLSEPFAVIVASHLQMKSDAATATLPIADIRRGPRSAPLDPMIALMPLALRSYVGRHLGGAMRWRTLLPGLRLCRVAHDVGGYASFLRCRPAKAIPSHTHQGIEAVLVLQGGFHDADGDYVRGDLAVADGTVDHRPVADGPDECVIFMVLGAPVKLTGPFGRFIPRTFGG
jgi:putative transcriptional regulator